MVSGKTGEIVDVTVSHPVEEAHEVTQSNGPGLRFDVESPVADGSLFYLGDLFVKGSFSRKGKTVDYRLA